MAKFCHAPGISMVATPRRGVIRLALRTHGRRYDLPAESPKRDAYSARRSLPMRWLLLVSTVFAFVLCFTRHSPGAWGFWMLVALLGVFASTLAFVQVRIDGNARADA
jgi:hypothetical protein